MTTSDYLSTQADLLIAYRLMRRANVDAFLAVARALVVSGAALRDYDGLPVESDAARMVCLAEAVQGLLAECGRDSVPRKPAAMETGRCAEERRSG